MSSRKINAFTMVELLVSISIFFTMTALLISKYGAFNNSVFLTNLAYDTALAVRTAQTYGLSVQGQNNLYQYPFGVAFCAKTSGCIGAGGLTFDNKTIIIFADQKNSDGALGAFDSTDIIKQKYTLQRGAYISAICLRSGANYNCNDDDRADVTFMRPNPDATICVTPNDETEPRACGAAGVGLIRIDIKAPDNRVRSVLVSKIGQVSIED